MITVHGNGNNDQGALYHGEVDVKIHNERKAEGKCLHAGEDQVVMCVNVDGVCQDRDHRRDQSSVFSNEKEPFVQCALFNSTKSVVAVKRG